MSLYTPVRFLIDIFCRSHPGSDAGSAHTRQGLSPLDPLLGYDTWWPAWHWPHSPYPAIEKRCTALTILQHSHRLFQRERRDVKNSGDTEHSRPATWGFQRGSHRACARSPLWPPEALLSLFRYPRQAVSAEGWAGRCCRTSARDLRIDLKSSSKETSLP